MSYLQKKEKGRNEDKNSSWQLENAKTCKKLSQGIVCHRYERLAALRLFSFEQVKELENLSEKLYTSETKKKRISRGEK